MFSFEQGCFPILFVKAFFRVSYPFLKAFLKVLIIGKQYRWQACNIFEYHWPLYVVLSWNPLDVSMVTRVIVSSLLKLYSLLEPNYGAIAVSLIVDF